MDMSSYDKRYPILSDAFVKHQGPPIHLEAEPSLRNQAHVALPVKSQANNGIVSQYGAWGTRCAAEGIVSVGKGIQGEHT
jgi:hypothetical protein